MAWAAGLAACLLWAIVRAARRPRPEIYPYPPSRAVTWANALFPGLMDWAWARAARKAGRI